MVVATIVTGRPGWGRKSKTWRKRVFQAQLPSMEALRPRVRAERELALAIVAQRNGLAYNWHGLKLVTKKAVVRRVYAIA